MTVDESLSQPRAVADGVAVGSDLVVRPESVLARAVTSVPVGRAASATRAVARRAAPTVGRSYRYAVAPAPHVGRVVSRFVAGVPMRGSARTDATFWRHGRHQYRDVSGHTSAWSFRPGWQRSLARLGGTATVWLGCESAWSTETIAATSGIGAIALLWGSHHAVSSWRSRQHRAEVLRPLHDALASTIGVSGTAPEEWLHIPANFGGPNSVAVIDLPSGFEVDNKDWFVRAVLPRLGTSRAAVSVDWKLEGSKPSVTVRTLPEPPKKLGWSELLPLLERSRDTAPIIGLDAQRRPVTVDLEADSPHILASAGSGAGKSVLLRVLLAQALAKGALGVVLDVKRMSHTWAAKLPNCEYYRSPEAIHDALLKLEDIVDQRTIVAEESVDEDGNVTADVGPRIFILAEEMNATVSRLSKYWKGIKEPGDPNTSPAVEALQNLLFMGRQVKVHVIAVAQMASARAMGGPEARENFGTRCLARYSLNNWKMLVPEVWPAPKKSKHPGRWQIVKSGEAVETQVFFLTEKEAKKLALKGRESGESQSESGLGGRLEQGQAPGTVPADDEPSETEGSTAESADDSEEIEKEAVSRLVSLRDAIEKDLVDGMKLDNLRKARQRYPDFPDPIAKRGTADLYDPDDLGRWARNRPAAVWDTAEGS